MTPPPRALLCSHRRDGVVQRAYETPLAVEVDAGSRYEVSRRRVFFDEVRLVTLHRERRLGYLLGTGILALALSLTWLSLARSPGATDLWRLYLLMWALTALPLMIAFVLRLALGVDVLTVQGRRTRAELRFAFRKQRAREVFARLCRLAREAQGSAP